jgi:hypothetical protein
MALALPIVHLLLIDFGLPFVVVAKVVVLSLVVAVVGVLAGRAALEHPRLTAAVFAIAIAVGLVGGWSSASDPRAVDRGPAATTTGFSPHEHMRPVKREISLFLLGWLTPRAGTTESDRFVG